MPAGLSLPIFGELADPRVTASIAAEAEAAGWDGVFVWDHLFYSPPVADVADPWVTLAAVAMATTRVRLGPMVTPLARRRPAKVAKETATLDVLSGGRLVLGAGLGSERHGEFAAFGEPDDPVVRAGLLDEALDVVVALWTGEAVSHAGPHFTVDGARLLPRPVQRPRPPVWTAGRWPHRAPLRRAARWDGVFPVDVPSPDALAELVASVHSLRPDETRDRPFDVVVHGPAGVDPRPWQAAGATWWLTTFSPGDVTAADVRAAVADGPPTAG